MARALLLDLGGTAFVSAPEAMAVYAEREPAVRGVCARRGPLGPEHDALWDRMMHQTITEREYWQQRSAEVGAALGRRWTVQEFMHVLHERGGMTLRPQAAALVADARVAGVPVGALTNDLQAFHGDRAMSVHAVLAELDVIVDGSVTGMLKPDPGSYALGAQALGLPAREIVFLDDMPWNVVGARRAGMIAVALDYTDPGAAFDEARAHLGLAARAA